MRSPNDGNFKPTAPNSEEDMPISYPALFEVPKNNEQNTKSAQELIKEAMRIKKEIDDLNKKLSADSILALQYEYFKKGELGFPPSFNYTNPYAEKVTIEKKYTATPEFVLFLNHCAQLAAAYHFLKVDVTQSGIATAFELEQIEKSGGGKFFPLYQSLYNRKCEEIHQKYNKIYSKRTSDLLAIRTQYAKRRKDYMDWHSVSGCFSIAGIGIPFLIAGLLAHTLDKLITTIRIRVLTMGNNSMEKERSAQLKAVETDITKAISESAEVTQFKQGFFQLNLTKGQSCVDIDKYKAYDNTNIKINTPR